MDLTPDSTPDVELNVKDAADVMRALPPFRFVNPTHPHIIAAAARHEDGRVMVTPTLASLVLLLKACGISRIVPDNLNRVVCRIEFYETALGSIRAQLVDGVRCSHYFTRDEIARFVGLTLDDTMHLSDELVAGRVYRLFRARRLAAMEAADAAVRTTPPNAAS